MKIVIYDNQFVFREGIKSILSDLKGYKLVGETDNFDDLLGILKKHKPDILICDLFSTNHFEFTQTESINSVSPNTHLLVITNENRDEIILKTLEIPNVDGYYFKNCRKIDIITSLTVIANNGKSFDHRVIECLYANLSNQKLISNRSDHPIKKLSKRETEIVKNVAEGQTAKEIANKMNISIHTVNTYKKNILKKLEVNNSSELVMYAIKNKLIDSTEYYI